MVACLAGTPAGHSCWECTASFLTWDQLDWRKVRVTPWLPQSACFTSNSLHLCTPAVSPRLLQSVPSGSAPPPCQIQGKGFSGLRSSKHSEEPVGPSQVVLFYFCEAGRSLQPGCTGYPDPSQPSPGLTGAQCASGASWTPPASPEAPGSI